MRIALLTDGLWPDTIGGMQKHSFYLAKYLAINNHQVDIYYSAKDVNQVVKQFSFDETLNLKFYRVDFPQSIHFPGHYVFNSYRFSKKIYYKLIENKPYDFVYAQGFTGWYFLNKNFNLGSNLHGLEMFQLTVGFKNRLIQKLLQIPAKKIIKKSKLSFSLGGKLTQILQSQKALKIAETPIGIDSNWLTEPQKVNPKIQFVFIGRNEWRKAVHLIYKALDEIENLNYQFHFIGIRQPENFNLENCKFYGEIKNETTIQNILKDADVLVCPSLAEGMPTVILEAMAKGLAIIATDTGATSLLVDNTNGQLIQPNNINQLIAAMQYILNLSQQELLALKMQSYLKVKENLIWQKSIITTIHAMND